VLTASDLPVVNLRQAVDNRHIVMALDRVLYVGQPVAVVLAESEAAAEDGAQAVEVEYEVQGATVDPLEALQPDAPVVRERGRADEDEHLLDMLQQLLGLGQVHAEGLYAQVIAFDGGHLVHHCRLTVMALLTFIRFDDHLHSEPQAAAASSSRWASTWLSQLPVRVPAEGTPLTLATPAASCGSSKPLSAASLARARWPTASG
jgi:hypothetical protein